MTGQTDIFGNLLEEPSLTSLVGNKATENKSTGNQKYQAQPLAARMRPTKLAEYVGQTHLLAEGKPLRVAVERGLLHSMIFWGPPGTGKTSLAELVCRQANAHIIRLSAVTSGVKDIREAISEAQKLKTQQQTVLFVDEVHRFNKSQQDAFLPHIEDGTIIFIGATTENPSFALNHALLSRARVYRVRPLTQDDIKNIVYAALNHTERGLGQRKLSLSAEAERFLIDRAEGDARRALNYLEVAADFVELNETGEGLITLAHIEEVAGEKALRFDNQGDEYYDLLSAFHKSVRGSSPDAALYWYTRFILAGGDPLVIARRLLAIASEDIGNADPRAIQLALNAWDTFQRVGPAEGERAIAQAAIFCACAAKSNAVYTAFNQVKALIQSEPAYSVPNHLKNAPTQTHKNEGFGADYQYAHDVPNAYVPGESYLPVELEGQRWYQPVERGLEIQIKAKLAELAHLDEQSDWKRYNKDN